MASNDQLPAFNGPLDAVRTRMWVMLCCVFLPGLLIQALAALGYPAPSDPDPVPTPGESDAASDESASDSLDSTETPASDAAVEPVKKCTGTARQLARAQLTTPPTGGVWVRTSSEPLLPAQPDFAPDSAGFLLPSIPSLAPIRKVLLDVDACSLADLSGVGSALDTGSLNDRVGARFQYPVVDEKGFFDAYSMNEIAEGKPNRGTELWYVEGLLLGVFLRMPTRSKRDSAGEPPLVVVIETAVGRPPDVTKKTGRATSTRLWVGGSTILALTSTKKFDTVLYALKDRYAAWQALESSSAELDDAIKKADAALTATPPRLEAAATTLRTVLATAPYHAAAASRLARVVYLSGQDYALVEQMVDTFLPNVRNPRIRQQLGYCKALAILQQNRVDEARTLLTEIDTARPLLPEAKARLEMLKGRGDAKIMEIALRELQCAKKGTPIRETQVSREFGGLSAAKAKETLQAILSLEEYEAALRRVSLKCGDGAEALEPTGASWED